MRPRADCQVAKGNALLCTNFRERLDRRLGQPGLLQAAHGQQPTPTAISSEQTSAPTASASEPKPALTASETQPASGGEREDSAATIRLANGTPGTFVCSRNPFRRRRPNRAAP